MGSSPLIWPEEGPLWWGRDGGRSVCRWGNCSRIRILTEALRMFLPSVSVIALWISDLFVFLRLHTFFGQTECHIYSVLISQSHAHSLSLLFGPCCCIELVGQKLQWHMTKARHEIQLGKVLLKISQPSLKRIAFDILVLLFTAHLGIALISKHPCPFLCPSLFISLSSFLFLPLLGIWLSW